MTLDITLLYLYIIIKTTHVTNQYYNDDLSMSKLKFTNIFGKNLE